jgi:hypothetical protein
MKRDEGNNTEMKNQKGMKLKKEQKYAGNWKETGKNIVV